MKYKEVLELRKKADINQVPQGLQDYQLGQYMAQPTIMQQPGTQGGFGFGNIFPMLMMGGLAAFGRQKQQANKVPAANAINKAPVATTQQKVPVNTAPRTFISSRDSKDLTAPKPIDPTAADVNAGKKTFIQGAQQIAQRGPGAAPVKKSDNTSSMLGAYGIQYPQAQ